MTKAGPPKAAPWWRRWGPGLVIFLAAVVAALPALRGGFIEGDDQQLVLNFLPVSRPSLSHAVELLGLGPHRYLYQPVPLLSFSAEFALIEALGLSPLPDAANSATWLFHLDNIFIHAISAVLLWRLVRRLHPDPLVGLLAGVLFAVHPMGMEPTAWLCGRMISLSTLFSLLALNLLQSWNERPRAWLAPLAPLATIMAMTSKVQVGLPLLMLIPLLILRRRPRASWWIIWGSCVLITAVFSLLNLTLTRQTGLMEIAAESLQGPRIIRVLIALAWYFRETVWPMNLAPFHPARAVVAWSDPDVLPGLAVLLLVVLVVMASLRWTRTGILGFAWFMAVVGATLPMLPSRHVMVAERYAYLANAGIYWAAAAFLVFIYRRWAKQTATRLWISGAAILLMVSGLMIVSWRTAGSFRNDIVRNTRVAEVYPEAPGSWWRLAWAYHDAGRYPEAVEIAQRDLARHPAKTARNVYQVVGMSYLKMNQTDRAVEALERALAADPDNARTHRFLAEAYQKAGNQDQALTHYRRAVEIWPTYEAALIELGQCLRTKGQTQEAMTCYARVLEDNPYHLPVNLAMAGIEIEQGRYGDARSRLQHLLLHVPDSWEAWTNLGVCQAALNDRRSAIESYHRALAVYPQAARAAINLAGLLAESGQMAEALRITETGLADTADRPLLWAGHDLLVGGGKVASAARLWWRAMQREPQAADLKAAYAWTCVLGGRWEEARSYTESAAQVAEKGPAVAMCRVMLALTGGDPAPGVSWLKSMQAAPDPDREDLLRRMRQALGAYGEAHPAEPWPYYLAGRIMLLQGERQTGELLLGQFREMCKDEACRKQAEGLGVAP